MNLVNAINQSVLTRFLANVFLFAVLMVSLGLAALELINQGSINPIITTILGTGIGIAAHAAGINQGVILTPMTGTGDSSNAKEVRTPSESGSS